ncbi:MAG: hypothetical protein ACK5WG_04685, partial [Betaproteobacteria bacterium]
MQRVLRKRRRRCRSSLIIDIMDIASIRTDYKRGELDETHAADDPIEQFSRWWEEARRSEIADVNA